MINLDYYQGLVDAPGIHLRPNVKNKLTLTLCPHYDKSIPNDLMGFPREDSVHEESMSNGYLPQLLGL